MTFTGQFLSAGQADLSLSLGVDSLIEKEKKIHVRVFGWDSCLKLYKEQVRLFNGRKMLCKGAVLNNVNTWPVESWTALQSFISTDKVAGVLKINRNISGVAGVTESLSCMQKKVIWGKWFCQFTLGCSQRVWKYFGRKPPPVGILSFLRGLPV